MQPIPCILQRSALARTLAILEKLTPDKGGQVYKVSRCAEASATPCASNHRGARAAHCSYYLARRIPRGLGEPRLMCPLALRTYI